MFQFEDVKGLDVSREGVEENSNAEELYTLTPPTESRRPNLCWVDLKLNSQLCRVALDGGAESDCISARDAGLLGLTIDHGIGKTVVKNVNGLTEEMHFFQAASTPGPGCGLHARR